MNLLRFIVLQLGLFGGLIISVSAQTKFTNFTKELTQDIEYNIEIQNTAGTGTYSPLWLNANKHGLSSVNPKNGYLRAGIHRKSFNDRNRNWEIGYGIDLALAYNFTSSFVVQQLFAEVRYKKGLLSFGSKEQSMPLLNNTLSSGSQTFGINSRPIPQLRLELPRYWNIPGTKEWLGIKGHIAYGKYTDNNWQTDFVAEGCRYTQDEIGRAHV